MYVDGDSVGELTDDELEKRRILGTEGFVSAFVVVDTDNHEVVTGPKIYLNAVAEDESEFDKGASPDRRTAQRPDDAGHA